MSAPTASDRARRALGRLWTGPVAHLLGGALDLGGALGRYATMRARRRIGRAVRPIRTRRS